MIMKLEALLVTLVGIEIVAPDKSRSKNLNNSLLEAGGFGHLFYNFCCWKSLSCQEVGLY